MAEPPATTPLAAATAERDVLLATKLHVPRSRPGFVARPRLADRLARAHGVSWPWCAPAGFGKTTVLAEWARRRQRPVAWLSLDEGDNDPVRFWRYVAAVLDQVRAGIGERVGVLLRGPEPASLEAVVITLVNRLAGGLAGAGAGLGRLPPDPGAPGPPVSGVPAGAPASLAAAGGG
jgi:LuxR family transcriptional regulator, maltose regulon positive regulatory protein